MAQNDDSGAFNGLKIWTGYKEESLINYKEIRPEFPQYLCEPVIEDFILTLPRYENVEPNNKFSPPAYHTMGEVTWDNYNKWKSYPSNNGYYAAIVEERY